MLGRSPTGGWQRIARKLSEMSGEHEYLGIDYMTRSHPLFWIAGYASRWVRRWQYEWFRGLVGGVSGKVILDHGSTPDTLSPDSNCFIRWLQADGAIVYATSLEDISHLPQLFPGLRIVDKPAIGRFVNPIDAVISSSVIAHVGSRDSQIAYLEDVLALSNCVFLSTPNRGHWLEFHTKLPFLHRLPKERHRAILQKLGMHFWASEANLNLLTREELCDLLSEAAAREQLSITSEWFEPRFLGQVSHLVTLVRSSKLVTAG